MGHTRVGTTGSIWGIGTSPLPDVGLAISVIELMVDPNASPGTSESAIGFNAQEGRDRLQLQSHRGVRLDHAADWPSNGIAGQRPAAAFLRKTGARSHNTPPMMAIRFMPARTSRGQRQPVDTVWPVLKRRSPKAILDSGRHIFSLAGKFAEADVDIMARQCD
jgi:hypothetical protein